MRGNAICPGGGEMPMTAKAETKRRKAEIEGLTDVEYFMRKEFQKYLESVMSAVISAFKKRKVKLSLYVDLSGSTAATSGEKVLVNVLAPFVEAVKTRTEKFLVILGLLAHECGHLLFTDFKHLKTLFSDFEKSGYLPPVSSPGYKEMEEELNEDAGLRRFMFPYLRHFQNVFEDGNIEFRFNQAFAGLPAIGLKFTRKVAYAGTSSLADMLESDAPLIDCMVVSYLTYIGDGITQGRVKGEKKAKACARYEEWRRYFSKAEDAARSLLFEPDSLSRCTLLTKVMVSLYPLIKEEYDKLPKSEEASEEDSSGEGSGEDEKEGSGSASDKKDTGTEASGTDLDKVMKDLGVAPMPESKGAKLNEREEEHLRRTSRWEDRDADTPDLDSAESAAAAELDAERTAKEAEQLADAGADIGVTYRLERSSTLSSTCRDQYAVDYDMVKGISKRTTRMLNGILKEREREGRLNGQLYGKRIDCRTAYRGDGRIFTRQLVPDGKPQVAFCILVDESGSMGFSCRAEMARQSAICLESVLREVDVPFAIVGHTADVRKEGEVSVYPYVRFDSYDKNDRYRLAEIKDRCENHDEAAILYCGQLLKERPEQQKVLIVISDGAPAASGLRGTTGIKRTSDAVAGLRKSGMEVFGAAIGGCAEAVRSIYGTDRLMDIEELDRLPSELIKIVKRFVLRRQA